MLYPQELTESSQQPCEEGTTSLPILQMQKLRPSTVKKLSQSHTGEGQSPDSHPARLTPGTEPVTTLPCCFYDSDSYVPRSPTHRHGAKHLKTHLIQSSPPPSKVAIFHPIFSFASFAPGTDGRLRSRAIKGHVPGHPGRKR